MQMSGHLTGQPTPETNLKLFFFLGDSTFSLTGLRLNHF
jgi:hypothetical protein